VVAQGRGAPRPWRSGLRSERPAHAETQAAWKRYPTVMTRRTLIVFSFALTAACSSSSPEPSPTPKPASAAPAAATTDRKYLLERVADAAVVQLYADGFSALPLDQKVLIYHLAEAALAGRDIYYDQRYAHGLEMREVIEQVLRHPGGVDAATLAAIQNYAKLFWINNSPYNNLTATKFVLEITPEAFAAAVKAAASAGGTFPLAAGESIDQMLTRMRPWFFDAAFEPSVTDKTAKDIIAGSHNNLYVGVTAAELKNFKEVFPLNSRVVKRDGKIIEEVYKADGRYGPQITSIIEHLTAAKAVAPASMAKALDALIQWYRTGTAADRKAYDIAWVQDTTSPVDTVNGFTEVYLDARGVKGAWEGIVSYVNQERTTGIKKLASAAQWFEDHMPWDAKYRKAGVQGITANAIDVIIETGDSGPITPIGINLPNDESVRQEYGSKSVSLSNVNEAYDKSTPTGFRGEFSWTPEEAARSAKWSALAGDLLTNMHEVIGHASGKLSDHLKGKPEVALKQYFSALEEGRADLVGLYFIGDPKLAELGLVPAADQAEIARTEYEGYTRNALVQLRRVKQGSTIAEDHMRNRQMVVRWLMANTKAIDTKERDGKTFYVMVDPAAFHDGVGKLLAEVQRIKSEGDFAAAQKLFETYGIHFEPKLRDQVVARVQALNLPSYTGFVMPELAATKDAGGKITDVKISYPMDLTKQMLSFADRTRATRDAFLKTQ
jgi:dipeptidyl-peptidase III